MFVGINADPLHGYDPKDILDLVGPGGLVRYPLVYPVQGYNRFNHACWDLGLEVLPGIFDERAMVRGYKHGSAQFTPTLRYWRRVLPGLRYLGIGNQVDNPGARDSWSMKQRRFQQLLDTGMRRCGGR